MPVTPKMTWDGKTSTWFGKYRKARFSRSCRQLGTAPTKEASISAANAWFDQKTQEIDARLDAPPTHRNAVASHYQEAIANASFYAEWAEFEGNQQEAKKYRQHVQWLQDQLASANPPFPLTKLQYDARAFEKLQEPNQRQWGGETVQALWDERRQMLRRYKESLANAAVIPSNKSLTGAVGSYLKTKLTLADAGVLSAARYEKMRISLGHLLEWMGEGKTYHDITGKMMIEYHGHLVQTVANGKWGPTYAKQHVDDLKQFIRYVVAIYDDFKQPRNFGDRGLNIKVQTKEIQPWTLEECKGLIAGAPTERTKLWILLALNTGMTQMDICHLYRFQVDYETGYIVRKRGKTKWHKTVPTIRYKLWNQTLELLKKFDSGRKGENDLVLVNRKGKEFVRYTRKANGKTNRYDTIGNLFNLFKKQLHGDTPKTFKSLRSCGATLLGSQPRYFFCAWSFLGHSPRTIAEKHYIKPTQELIDEAIRWLGDQLGVK